MRWAKRNWRYARGSHEPERIRQRGSSSSPVAPSRSFRFGSVWARAPVRDIITAAHHCAAFREPLPEAPSTGPQLQGPPSTPLTRELISSVATARVLTRPCIHACVWNVRGGVEVHSCSAALRPRSLFLDTATDPCWLKGLEAGTFFTNLRVCSRHWRMRQTLRLMAKWVTFQFHRL